MNYEYICKKEVPKKKDIREAEIYFRNGDYFTAIASEIVELQVEYYDQLVEHGRGFVPFARSGFLKLKLCEKKKKDYDFIMYDDQDFKKSRKAYLEKRCVEEGGAFYFQFRNKINWSRSFLADSIATKEGEYLVFTFLENRTMGFFESEYHNVKIREINRGALHHMDLDFENCESIKLYPEEIKEIQLNFDKELKYNSDSYSRRVTGGYLRIKFDNEYLSWHIGDNCYLFEKKPTMKKLERRIVGKKGESEIDICNLYVTYLRGGVCNMLEEHICVPDLNEEKAIKNLFENYNDDSDDDGESKASNEELPFVSGYAKRDTDGSILIVFGKLSEK